MIAHSIFYDRRDNHCTHCEFWKGACIKGHKLSSPAGCPVRKFEPVNGADYAPDVPLPEPTEPGCGCGKTDSVAPLTYPQAFGEFTRSLARWAIQGAPLANDEQHSARHGVCKVCPRYMHFQCTICKCVVMVKAKMLTEKCPEDRWPV